MDEFQFTWINSDTLRICCRVNGTLKYLHLHSKSIVANEIEIQGKQTRDD